MGSATIASIRNFQRQREKASQEAMGRPIANSSAETISASRNVSQNACQSMDILSSPLRG
jgi:hypothetical protein